LLRFDELWDRSGLLRRCPSLGANDSEGEQVCRSEVFMGRENVLFLFFLKSKCVNLDFIFCVCQRYSGTLRSNESHVVKMILKLV